MAEFNKHTANDSSPKKSLGQHWLHDSAVLESIVKAANLTPDDTVVEVGPGLGTLTEKLLQTGSMVIAIEFDDSLINGLNERFGGLPNFSLVHQDVLKFNFSELPKYKIVANIPYYLTSQLLRIIGDAATPPQTAVLLVQKEVAERVCAQPPDMSILTVAVQFEFKAQLGEVVPARLFTPPPKVDSQVMVLQRHPQPLFNDITKKDFMRVVKAGFSAKRKTLRNTLSAGLAMSKPAADELLSASGIDPQRRAETLSLQEWHALVKMYYS